MQTLGQVFLLPLPVDVVDLGVVEVEEGFCGRGTLVGDSEDTDFNVLEELTTRAVGCVASLTKDTSDTKVAAAVDVRHGERSSSLKSVSEVVECRLGKSALELCWVGEEVEDTGCEVTSQTRSTLRLANVDLKVGARERTVLNAASSGTTELSKAKDVLSGSEFDVLAVATEAGCGREDICLEGLCRVTIVWLRIKGPVPVSVRCQLDPTGQRESKYALTAEHPCNHRLPSKSSRSWRSCSDAIERRNQQNGSCRLDCCELPGSHRNG